MCMPMRKEEEKRGGEGRGGEERGGEYSDSQQSYLRVKCLGLKIYCPQHNAK